MNYIIIITIPEIQCLAHYHYSSWNLKAITTNITVSIQLVNYYIIHYLANLIYASLMNLKLTPTISSTLTQSQAKPAIIQGLNLLLTSTTVTNLMFQHQCALEHQTSM